MPTRPRSSMARARLRVGRRLVGLNHLHDLPPDAIQRMETRERILEDHRDAAAAHGPQLVGRRRQQILSLEQRLARDPCPRVSPTIVCVATLLPDPDSPTMPSTWPRATEKERPLTASRRSSGVLNATRRSRTSSSGATPVGAETGVIVIRLIPAGRRRATATRDRS